MLILETPKILLFYSKNFYLKFYIYIKNKVVMGWLSINVIQFKNEKQKKKKTH